MNTLLGAITDPSQVSGSYGTPTGGAVYTSGSEFGSGGTVQQSDPNAAKYGPSSGGSDISMEQINPPAPPAPGDYSPAGGTDVSLGPPKKQIPYITIGVFALAAYWLFFRKKK